MLFHVSLTGLCLSQLIRLTCVMFTWTGPKKGPLGPQSQGVKIQIQSLQNKVFHFVVLNALATLYYRNSHANKATLNLNLQSSRGASGYDAYIRIYRTFYFPHLGHIFGRRVDKTDGPVLGQINASVNVLLFFLLRQHCII